MREPLFIKKNKERWDNYDNFETNDPDELSDRFLHIMDDLSYAQTFYPKSKTHRYLNERATSFYNEIYKRKRNNLSSILYFWKYDLPLIVRNRHRYLLISLLFTIVFFLIGWFSVEHNPDFLDTYLSRDYVDMTHENIKQGNPFGVYSDENNAFSMFVRIGINNIRVALLCFVSGLVFTVGTLYFLFQNGLMLGGFEKIFFMHPELGWQSMFVIWIHGVLEISAIIIAGGAGISLGNSFLFPGSFTRKESLKRAALDGVKIMMGLIPIFVVAALLESYVTRLSSNYFMKDNANVATLPIWGSAGILAVSLLFIVWYFIIYPIRIENYFLKLAKEATGDLVIYDKKQ
jgi:uncharacterized membrane protein SpoIIM required for sporulation